MNELIEELKRAVRVSSPEAEGEIQALIASCKSELKLSGVNGDESDPLYRQAIRLYCKSQYGYDADVERFRSAFESLRDAMALSGEYREVAVYDGSTNLE